MTNLDFQVDYHSRIHTPESNPQSHNFVSPLWSLTDTIDTFESDSHEHYFRRPRTRRSVAQYLHDTRTDTPAYVEQLAQARSDISNSAESDNTLQETNQERHFTQGAAPAGLTIVDYSTREADLYYGRSRPAFVRDLPEGVTDSKAETRGWTKMLSTARWSEWMFLFKRKQEQGFVVERTQRARS